MFFKLNYLWFNVCTQSQLLNVIAIKRFSYCCTCGGVPRCLRHLMEDLICLADSVTMLPIVLDPGRFLYGRYLS